MSTAPRNPGKILSLLSQSTLPDGSVVVIGSASMSCALPAGASPASVMLLGLVKNEGGGSAASGDTVDVVTEGVYPGIASDASITAGDRVTSGGTDGKLIKAAPAGGTNCAYVGIAMETPASGDRFAVLIAPGIMQG